MAAPSSMGSAAPKSPRLSRTSGSMARGTPNSFSSSRIPVARLQIPQHGARGIGDIGGMHLARRVSFQISQLSMVPNAMSRAAFAALSHSSAAIPAWWRRNRDRAAARSCAVIFGFQPCASSAPRSAPRCAGPARRWRCAAARPSCGPRSAMVSRWLVMPMAATSPAAMPFSTARQQASAACQISRGVMLDPAIGGIDLAAAARHGWRSGRAVGVEQDGAGRGGALVDGQEEAFAAWSCCNRAHYQAPPRQET